MTTDDFIAHYKYSVLEHAYKNKNIADTCRLFNLSRTVYYKWLKRFNKLGYTGLINKQRSKWTAPQPLDTFLKSKTSGIIVNNRGKRKRSKVVVGIKKRQYTKEQKKSWSKPS